MDAKAIADTTPAAPAYDEIEEELIESNKLRPEPGQVAEVHMNEMEITFTHIRTMDQFLSDWSHLGSKLQRPDTIDPTLVYLGVVDEFGAYLRPMPPKTGDK